MRPLRVIMVRVFREMEESSHGFGLLEAPQFRRIRRRLRTERKYSSYCMNGPRCQKAGWDAFCRRARSRATGMTVCPISELLHRWLASTMFGRLMVSSGATLPFSGRV